METIEAKDIVKPVKVKHISMKVKIAELNDKTTEEVMEILQVSRKVVLNNRWLIKNKK